MRENIIIEYYLWDMNVQIKKRQEEIKFLEMMINGPEILHLLAEIKGKEYYCKEKIKILIKVALIIMAIDKDLLFLLYQSKMVLL